MRFRLFTLALLLSTPAYGGAWTLSPGEGLAITQVTYFENSEYFDIDGNTTPQERFSKMELQPYLEYGLNDWATIGATAYLHRVDQDGNNYGIGDPEFFLRTRLWQSDGQVISLEPRIKTKSYYQHAGQPRGGSSHYEAELAVLYGRSWELISDRDFVDMRFGYRWRGAGLSPQYRADVSYGVQLTDRWQLVPSMRSIIASEIDATAFQEGGDLDYDLSKAEIAALYHLDERRWVQATIFRHIMGIQVGGGTGVSLAYAQRF